MQRNDQPQRLAPFVASPLDAWRGSGREARRLGLTRPPAQHEIPTITTRVSVAYPVDPEPLKIATTTK
jgi:hypothetical protein